MLIAHRANIFSDFYKFYYKNNLRSFEIDVQLLNDNIIVYHDDILDLKDPTIDSTINQTINPKIPTLEDYLKYTPDNIHLNIEIKRYFNNNFNKYLIIVNQVLDLCKKYPKEKFSFSSFDKETYECLLEKADDVWHLQDKIEKYDSTSSKICIHKDMINHIDPKNHTAIYVYDVKIDEIPHCELNKYIKGWIVDVLD